VDSKLKTTDVYYKISEYKGINSVEIESRG
jgi:hypothetical protein